MQRNSLDYQVERLEERRLLDGNVNALITNAGDLRITGDHHNNQISIVAEPWNLLGPRRIRIGGSNGTTINGLAENQGEVFEFHALRDLKINLRGGDDIVNVGAEPSLIPLTFRNGIISGGGGNDLIDIGRLGDGDIKFNGNLRVMLNGGAKGALTHELTINNPYDQIAQLDSVDVGGNLTIRGAATLDAVKLLDGETRGVAGRTNITLGGGDDYAQFWKREMVGPVRVNLGGGNDELLLNQVTTQSTFRAHGGAGSDTLLGPFNFTHTIDPEFVSFEP